MKTLSESAVTLGCWWVHPCPSCFWRQSNPDWSLDFKPGIQIHYPWYNFAFHMTLVEGVVHNFCLAHSLEKSKSEQKYQKFYNRVSLGEKLLVQSTNPPQNRLVEFNNILCSGFAFPLWALIVFRVDTSCLLGVTTFFRSWHSETVCFEWNLESDKFCGKHYCFATPEWQHAILCSKLVYQKTKSDVLPVKKKVF